jgi:hypothetical protein
VGYRAGLGAVVVAVRRMAMIARFVLLTLTLREGEEIRGPTTTNTPPDNPLQFTIREGAVLRGPLIISVCGTDARIEVSQP